MSLSKIFWGPQLLLPLLFLKKHWIKVFLKTKNSNLHFLRLMTRWCLIKWGCQLDKTQVSRSTSAAFRATQSERCTRKEFQYIGQASVGWFGLRVFLEPSPQVYTVRGHSDLHSNVVVWSDENTKSCWSHSSTLARWQPSQSFARHLSKSYLHDCIIPTVIGFVVIG